VHTAYEYLIKGFSGEERTIKEKIAGIEALKYLYPELHTPAHEMFLQALKEGRVTFISEQEWQALKEGKATSVSPSK
jgi:hypothetical protein